MVQDLLWLTQVGVDHGGVVVAVQDGLAVRDGDRVDVRVDHPRGGVGLLGDLVHVALGGDAGAYVEELPDAGRGQEPHGPAQERPVGPGERPGVGVHRGKSPARVLVDQEIMAAAQQVVIDPGSVRPPGVDARRYPVGLVSQAPPVSE